MTAKERVGRAERLIATLNESFPGRVRVDRSVDFGLSRAVASDAGAIWLVNANLPPEADLSNYDTVVAALKLH